MKISLNWLKDHKACKDGIVWWKENKMDEIDHAKLCKILLNKDKFAYANWLVCELMSNKDKVRYAINAAELVLHIFEEKYPNDDRPRKAIEAAKHYLKNPSYTYAAAYADAVYAAAHAAEVAAEVADINAAAVAAYTAAYAAYAAYAANAAYNAAAVAANAAANSADAAHSAHSAVPIKDRKEIKLKIIKYALSLIL
jgi:hypothetical protein